MFEDEQERHIYTVSELTQNIKFVLEDAFGYVWVEGEISNLRSPGSGHLYFTLKDQFSELRAVMFKNSNTQLKFDLEDGLHVLCYGKITVYEKRGEYQIKVEYIEPKGYGALMLALEQLKKKLASEGLFDARYKKQIPFLPQKIGIVTSITGAAIRDILRVLRRRFYNLHIFIYPVRVQGEYAAAEIARAIREFNSMMEKMDVLIVGRGGGSIEDLWAFNEEIVARAIFDSEIPVISAVGHERDWTISDFVADLRAPTPSAAAEMVVRKKAELEDTITQLSRRLTLTIQGVVDKKRKIVEMYAGHYGLKRIQDLIPEKMQRIDELQMRMKNRITDLVNSRKEALKTLAGSYGLKRIKELIPNKKQRIEELQARTIMKMEELISAHKEKLGYITHHLNNLNPLSILSRGYSLSIDVETGKILKDSVQLKVGDKIRTKLFKGGFISRVEKIEKEDESRRLL
ncbi:MAG: exodeoxyribonuclease VII large subunit [Candidatus Omnitrophota bacterium]|nr:MAG: exodeoxyribonuclease VII large subunit [Candidatus Omnitrophota bacterium]